jgi:hypothetical protein
LTALHLSGRGGVTDGTLQTLRQLPLLESLAVYDAALDASWCLEAAKALPKLQSLEIDTNQFSADLGTWIVKTPQLTRLTIRRGTDEQFRRLLDAPHIESLGDLRLATADTCREMAKRLPNLAYIGATETSDEKAIIFASFAKLRLLQMGHSPDLTDEGLKPLRTCSSLYYLNVTACPRLTDNGIKVLHDCQALEQFVIQSCPGITKPALEALHNAQPQCRIISDFGAFEPTAPATGADRSIRE